MHERGKRTKKHEPRRKSLETLKFSFSLIRTPFFAAVGSARLRSGELLSLPGSRSHYSAIKHGSSTSLLLGLIPGVPTCRGYHSSANRSTLPLCEFTGRLDSVLRDEQCDYGARSSCCERAPSGTVWTIVPVGPACSAVRERAPVNVRQRMCAEVVCRAPTG